MTRAKLRCAYFLILSKLAPLNQWNYSSSKVFQLLIKRGIGDVECWTGLVRFGVPNALFIR